MRECKIKWSEGRAEKKKKEGEKEGERRESVRVGQKGIGQRKKEKGRKVDKNTYRLVLTTELGYTVTEKSQL